MAVNSWLPTLAACEPSEVLVLSARVAAQANGNEQIASSPATTNISTTWVRPTESEPSSRSPSRVPTTVPRKPAVPNMPTSSARRSFGPRLEMNVIEAPLAPATAQQ